MNSASVFLLSLLIPIFSWAYIPVETKSGEQNELPNAIEGVGIDEKLNQFLPGEVTLVKENGEKTKLKDFLGLGRPVILSLVYYSCPSLCNLHLRGVFDVLSRLKLKPGEDYELLAVSIDPKEDSDLAAAKKSTYLEQFNIPNSGQGLHFLTAPGEDIKKLSSAVGFRYKWNEKAQEWAHASAAIISTPDGKISRYLHGVYFEPKTFRLSVVEASKGLVGSIIDSVALYCFRYDPSTNKYAFYAFNVMRAAAVIMLVILLVWLVPVWIRSRRRQI